jgi:hypothetical protein
VPLVYQNNLTIESLLLYGPNRTEKGRRRRRGGEGNLYKVCELGISVDYQSMHL